jgi:phosphoketolase
LPELRELPPKGERRMSANPHANGGKLRNRSTFRTFRDYAVPIVESRDRRRFRRRKHWASFCAM